MRASLAYSEWRIVASRSSFLPTWLPLLRTASRPRTIPAPRTQLTTKTALHDLNGPLSLFASLACDSAVATRDLMSDVFGTPALEISAARTPVTVLLGPRSGV